MGLQVGDPAWNGCVSVYTKALDPRIMASVFLPRITTSWWIGPWTMPVLES